ncbi:hypothetical protein [Shewanella atlantica]|uniref:Uncharacterized protein n=1 Tax=Shewanella atlantica TaxID=271099 RepID=A0A3S0KS70_9GAMM|nr:hypothetical protein [Shewanella atlantica]RTR33170.1 hypothetical protein EKG39_05315 [Shewanella atlantica]
MNTLNPRPYPANYQQIMTRQISLYTVKIVCEKRERYDEPALMKLDSNIRHSTLRLDTYKNRQFTD